MSAAVLLLPPIALGAAVYAMLPAREEGAVPAAARTVVDSQRVAQLPPGETLPAAAEAQQPPQPAAAATQPRTAAAKPALATPSFSLASARQEPAGKAAAKDGGTKDAPTKEAVSGSGKDTARVLSPVPVRVTVVVPPSAAPFPPATEADSAPAGSITGSITGSINAWPARVVAAEVPEPEPPLSRVPAVQEPIAQSSTTEAAPAAAPRKHVRFSYLRHLARRSGAHAEARSEIRAARWNARSEQAFSLRNWLLGSGSRQRNTRS